EVRDQPRRLAAALSDQLEHLLDTANLLRLTPLESLRQARYQGRCVEIACQPSKVQPRRLGPQLNQGVVIQKVQCAHDSLALAARPSRRSPTMPPSAARVGGSRSANFSRVGAPRRRASSSAIDASPPLPARPVSWL